MPSSCHVLTPTHTIRSLAAAHRMGAKASKASQAKDRQNKLDRLAKLQEATQALLIGEQKKPALTLAKPPACGMTPLALRAANIRHPLGVADIITGADLQVTKGMRLLLRGPNGAGKSTVLKALAGQLTLGEGQRVADDRLELGVFAQDLAQELPQQMDANEYVAEECMRHDPTLTPERIRAIMGTLGLVGEKAVRPIGMLSGGEKARVALATFCLTPCNVLLLDEPTNHLDVEAIAALLEAISQFEGAIVVISHDRAFSEAIEATHVGYVANGAIEIEERSLRESDWNEMDRGVLNVGGADEPLAAAAAAAVEEPVGGASDGAAAMAGERATAQAKAAAPAVETEEQRLVRLEKAAQLERVMSAGLQNAPLPPPPPPPPPAAPAPAALSKKEVAKAVKAQAAKEKQAKKVKVTKKDREEYATIEAEVEALEIAAAEAHANMEAGNAAKPRLPMNDLLALADAASASRRAADERMERYLELEEIMLATAEA
jgi:ABC-type multidrug transport system ATPase subunit